MSKCATCGVDLGFLNTTKECETCKMKRVTADRIENDFSSAQPYFGRGVDKNNIDNAKSKFFHNNEYVIGAFKGESPGLGLLNQYLIISNIRVIFWKRGLIEDINNSFNFDEISSVQENKVLLENGIELNIRGAKETFPYMSRDDVTLAVKLIREQMQKDKNKLTPVIFDSIPAQIKKLAELRDSGILTEQEFTNKKTELLKRM
ncbi:MAG: SHOCT domain-containing protein [Methanoregula sp.]|jgi:hypothetical protein|nr:SHOCT domain-containing protein [Methanoregula sp.]